MRHCVLSVPAGYHEVCRRRAARADKVLNESQSMTSESSVTIGIITVSDRASRGEYEDRSGPAIRGYLESALDGNWKAEYRIVSDERPDIVAAIAELSDARRCCLILTTGGTGPTPRDVTPEATAEACEKLLPGFGERMRAVSVEKVPTAILSRQQAGVRGNTLIINLPGSPKAIAECLDAVFPAITHCTRLLGNALPHVDDDARPECGCG